MTSKTRGRHPIDLHALNAIARGQRRYWIIVKLSAGDDTNPLSALSQVKGQITEDLAGRRMIRKEVSIEEDDPRSHGLSHAGAGWNGVFVPRRTCAEQTVGKPTQRRNDLAGATQNF